MDDMLNEELSIQEAIRQLRSINESEEVVTDKEMTDTFEETTDEDIDEELDQEVDVPTPYDQYYEVIDYEPEEGEYQIGDQIEGYDARVLAYLVLKPEYDETTLQSEAFLVDDPDYPVCYVAGGRLYPIEVLEEN